jgi:hypothetical protein
MVNACAQNPKSEALVGIALLQMQSQPATRVVDVPRGVKKRDVKNKKDMRDVSQPHAEGSKVQPPQHG